MARVRICRVCRYPNAVDELFCQRDLGDSKCGGSLEGLPMIDEGEIPAEADDCTEPTEGVDEIARDREGADKLARAMLDCPFGKLEVMGSLAIGRDSSFCAEAVRFSDYMTISGVHARVFCSENKWFVRDLGSTNGTFLNGVQLGVDEEHLVFDGDQLNFSKSFRTVFRVLRGLG